MEYIDNYNKSKLVGPDDSYLESVKKLPNKYIKLIIPSSKSYDLLS